MHSLSPPVMQHLRHSYKILISKTEMKTLETFRHRWENSIKIFLIVVQEPYSDLGRVIVEVSRSRAVRHIALGRTPLDEGLARCRGLYVTTQNIHN